MRWFCPICLIYHRLPEQKDLVGEHRARFAARLSLTEAQMRHLFDWCYDKTSDEKTPDGKVLEKK